MEPLRIESASSPDGAASDGVPEGHAAPDARHDGWTPARQARFLRRLGATHCVSEAARSVGMSRQSAYKLRNRLRGEPFGVAWECAFRRKFDALADSAMTRAIHGVEVPHFFKGELIHTSRRYDERLTVALLAMRAGMTEIEECHAYNPDRIDPDNFAALLDRVEHGRELWIEEEQD